MSSSDREDFNEEKRKAKMQEARTVRKIVGITLGVLVLVLIVGGVSGYLYISSALKPVDPSSEDTKQVEIPIGSSTTQIASILEENNIVKDSTVFRYYIKFKNESGFQAGDYQFSPSMTHDELISALKTGKIKQEAVFEVTVQEGLSLEQIASKYASKTSLTKEEFMNKVDDLGYVETLIDQYPSILTDAITDPEIQHPLEGYLFPATYSFFEEDPSVDVIVRKMLQKTQDVVTPYLDSIGELQINGESATLHEAVTLSSLVEEEAPGSEDRKAIAGVFYNRLEKDMPLQTDPTVLYAVGTHKEEITKKDLQKESPYNTYVIQGLPVGPISNFSEDSLQSILEPKESEHTYFLAAPDGEVYYSKTYDEHLELKKKYLD
ncbi:hypothetical protein N781_10930 [Pontibacillus halophilus JSM 076056 = DSM 19796]|uniref:Endolytic murein transglycosylase n=1 Tax=Pontibacillus halophilus JSM 076056 = DSM 19796 TaxID=1385510 RepID=A0A0A5ICJ1_9BACI|nr:endolytic transglycosylase MltG [Pontibacillus halophilus]KGX93537.1 hypothetical protein N781_10930 [Pontibacillus halophilus JSM 076056 = DSM 19796]